MALSHDDHETADQQSEHHFPLSDTAPQREFDDLVGLACVVCGTTSALVTLIDADRYWVRAQVGLEGHDLTGGVSVCTRALPSRDLLIVPDLAVDPRFIDDPVVAGPPQARFCAVAPLVTDDGRILGTLCVLDTLPRELTSAQAGALEILGRRTASLIELRQSVLRSERNMAERANVRAELRTSEERLRLALASVGMAIWDWDTRDNTFICSADFAPVFGYPAVEWKPTGEAIFAATHPDDREKAQAALQIALTEGKGYSIEIRIAWPDGSLHWLACTTEVHLDVDGKPVRLVGAVQDITERKRAVEATRTSQEMLQLIMDNVPQSIFWKDTDSVYLGCNRNFARDAGIGSPDEIIAKTDYDMPWKPEETEAFLADDHEVMDSDTQKLHLIEPLRQADGRILWLETNKVPLHDTQGNVVGVMGTYEDITYRLEAEDALHRSEQLLRTVINSAPIVLFATDAEGTMTLCEGKGLQALGMRAGDTVGTSIFEGVKDSPNVAADLRRALAGEALNTISQFGGITFDNWYSPVRAADGGVAGIVGVSFNISQRAQAERELRASEARFFAFMDNSPALTYVKDDAGRFIYGNRTFERCHGLSPEQYLGRTAAEIMPAHLGREDACRNIGLS